jgi:hypothetical protein
MNASAVVDFAERKPTGAAIVLFAHPEACLVCGGLVGVTVQDSDGPRFIADRSLAVAAEAIRCGYRLRVNEERAGRGAFRMMDGHDGWPDDWQSALDIRDACSCEPYSPFGPDDTLIEEERQAA